MTRQFIFKKLFEVYLNHIWSPGYMIAPEKDATRTSLSRMSISLDKIFPD